ncbi:MAG: Rdx family protein [Anaerolineales bacterium]|nr:Rdx family protein [Anaerolineales bacterium]
MDELVKAYEPQIESFTLIPSDGGRFELTVNGKLIYSKLRTGLHVESGELVGLVRQFLKEVE